MVCSAADMSLPIMHRAYPINKSIFADYALYTLGNVYFTGLY